MQGVTQVALVVNNQLFNGRRFAVILADASLKKG